jgi:hypothetical protein
VLTADSRRIADGQIVLAVALFSAGREKAARKRLATDFGEWRHPIAFEFQDANVD